MRAGRLKTRRYKTGRGGAGWAALLLLTAVMALYGARLWRAGYFSPRQAAASPAVSAVRETAREKREITLPGKTWYALSLAPTEDAPAARREAESFRGRGAAGYVWGGSGCHVLLAAYETRLDARKVIGQLRSLHGVESRVEEISRPEITLMLAGEKQQLTALADAYSLMDQAAEQLSALSQGLDAGTADRLAAMEILSSLRDTALSLRARLDALFEAPSPAAVESVAAMLDDLSQALAAAQSASGAARLGAQVKYCQLLCVCRMAEHFSSLAAG